MTNESFDDRIIRQYQNRLLTEMEISLICNQAVEEGILQKEEVRAVPNCSTVELLNNIKRWKSAYLYDALKLDGSSDSEYETIKENIDEEQETATNKLFENDNASCFYTPNKQANSSYMSQIYNSPVNSKIVRQDEPEDPFSSPFRRPLNFSSPKENMVEFESFCEDLKEKTKSIKKSANDRTSETVKKLVDGFIEYTEKRSTGERNAGNRFYTFLILLILALICLYTPKPI